MRAGALIITLCAACACPGPSTPDAGTGGGAATGGGTGIGGGSTGGGTGTGGGAQGGGFVPLGVCIPVDAGPTPDAGAPPPPPTGAPWDGGYDTFCSAYAARYCDYLLACDQAAPGTRADCVALFDRYYCGVLIDEVARGMQLFDPQAAGNCLVSIAFDGGCVDYGCTPYLVPDAGPGGACLQPQDCPPSNACTGPTCARHCADAGALNQPCLFGSCDDNLVCDTGQCRPPGGVDAGCTTGGSFRNPQCERTQTFCDTDAGRCRPLPTAGQPCLPLLGCAPQHWCDFSTNPDVCRSFTAVGQPCTSTNACGPSAYCSTTCRDRGDAGASCISSPQCFPGLNCVTGACAAPKQNGEACSTDFQCQFFSGCDAVLRVCEPSVAHGRGEGCTQDQRTCVTGTRCLGAQVNPDGGVGCTGTCVPHLLGDRCTATDCPAQAFCSDAGVCTPADGGNPCANDSQCLTSDWCSTGKTCRTRTPFGQSCTRNNECEQPWQCAGGTCGAMGHADAGCTSMFECQLPLVCSGGRCVPGGHANEACLYGAFCIDGACESDGGAGRCVALRDAGEACFDAPDCASGYCFDQSCNPRCQ